MMFFIGLTIVFLLGVIGSYFLIPFLMTKLILVVADDKKVDDKLGMRDLSIKQSLNILGKFLMFFIFPQKKYFKVIDITIANPLSNILRNDSANVSLHKIYSNYVKELDEIKKNKVDINLKMDISEVGSVLSHFKIKELILWGIIIFLYSLALLIMIENVLEGVAWISTTAMISITYNTWGIEIFLATFLSGVAIYITLNLLKMLIISIFALYENMNIVNTKRLIEFVNMNINYTVINANKAYNNMSFTAYEGVLETFILNVNRDKQLEYNIKIENLSIDHLANAELNSGWVKEEKEKIS